MTTLIKHYVRKETKMTGMKHWEAIFDDGVLKTEKKIANHFGESDLLWFTTADTVAGGASCYLLQLVRTFMRQRIVNDSNLRELINAKFAEHWNEEDEYLCFVFNADDIGAERWNAYKEKWRSGSTERGHYVKNIDGTSNCNGDDTRDYWITEQDVDITKAKDFYIVTDSSKQRLQRFGFADYYDFYLWCTDIFDKADKMGVRVDSNEFYKFVGREMIKRDSHKTLALVA